MFLCNGMLVFIWHISCFRSDMFFPSLSLLCWYFPHFSSLISCFIVCNYVIYIAFFFQPFVPLLWNILAQTHLLFPAQSLLKQLTDLQGIWRRSALLFIPLPLLFHVNPGAEPLRVWSGIADPNSVHPVLKTKTKYHSGMQKLCMIIYWWLLVTGIKAAGSSDFDQKPRDFSVQFLL